MINIMYVIFIIIIKDLKLCYRNKNFIIEEQIILFNPYTQISKIYDYLPFETFLNYTLILMIIYISLCLT